MMANNLDPVALAWHLLDHIEYIHQKLWEAFEGEFIERFIRMPEPPDDIEFDLGEDSDDAIPF